MKCQTPQNDTFILNIDNEYFCNSHLSGNDMQKWENWENSEHKPKLYRFVPKTIAVC